MAGNVRIKIEGIDKLKGATATVMKAIKLAGIQELNMIGEEVMAESKEKYVPWDTGALRSTGTVVHGTPSKFTVKMVYGGRSAPYAVYVHEIQKNYKKGRQWKYLETPAKARAGSIGKEVGAAMVRAAQSHGM